MNSWIRNLSLSRYIIFWDKVNDSNLEEYRIYKSLDGGSSWDIIASGISTDLTQYTISDIPKSTYPQTLFSVVSVISGEESSKDITRDTQGEKYSINWVDVEGASQYKIYKGSVS